MSFALTPEEGEHLRKFLGHIDGQVVHIQKDLSIQDKTIDFFKTMAKLHHIDISTFPQYTWAQFKREIDKALVENLKIYRRYPLYCLLHATSDLEIEDYRQDLLNSLSHQIADANQKIMDDTASKEKLETQLAELFKGIDHLSNSYNFNNAGGVILSSLAKYYRTDSENPLIKGEEEKQELEQRYKEIQAMTKDGLLDLLRSDYLGEEEFIIFSEPLPVSSIDTFLATIASDEKRLFACLPLMAQYASLKADTKIFELPCQINIPSILKMAFEKAGAYDVDDEHTTNPTIAFYAAVSTLEELREIRKMFLQELIDAKLVPLVKYCKNQYYNNPSFGDYKSMETFVNLPFLYDHIEKIVPDSNAKLWIESLLARYRKLTRKLFKRKSDKKKIQYLYEELIKERNGLYDRILSWYRNFPSVHGVEQRIAVNFTEYSDVNIGNNTIAFNTLEEDIKEYIDALESLCDEYKAYAYDKVAKENEIAAELFRYVGVPISLTDVNFDVTDAENFNKLSNAYVRSYIKSTIEYVEAEAQNIANMNMAKLQSSMPDETASDVDLGQPNKQKTLGTMKPNAEQ